MVSPKKQTIFTQGDAADAVFYVQEGEVRLTVVSKTGKEQLWAYCARETFSEKVAWLDNLSHGVRNRHDGLRTSAH